MSPLYLLAYGVCRIGFFFWHPVFRVRGRENIPQSGAMFCGNHSGMADPIWVLFALGIGRRARIMAKAQLLRVPVLGAILKWVGVFGVDRGKNDVGAIKTALSVLKNDQRLLLFPEGTRVDPAHRIPAKPGAALMATRTDCLVVPVYITPRKAPFVPVTVVFGTPYKMAYEGKKATSEELQQNAVELLDRIYALGDLLCK